MITTLSHHDPSDPYFHSHVLMFREHALCLGCTASKVFLYILLPILIITFISPAFGKVEMVLVGVGLIGAIVTIREIVTGKPRHQVIGLVPELYLLSTVAYVALHTSAMSLGSRLLMSTILGLPQVGIYLWKITTKREFTKVKTKFLVRMSFITAFFFALINFQNSIALSGLYIVSAAMVFNGLRRYSSFSINNSQVFLHPGLLSSMAGILESHGYIEADGLLARMDGWMVFLLIAIGVLTIGPSPVCAVPSKIATIGSPMLLGSASHFCPNCGASVKAGENFCESCGTPLNPNQRVSQQGMSQQGSQPYGRQQGGQQPYNPNYGGSSYSTTGSYGSGYTGQRKPVSVPFVAAGAVVVAIIVFFLTQSIGIAIVAGVLAFVGMYLAASSNDFCASYCIMDTCCNCICSLVQDSMDNN